MKHARHQPTSPMSRRRISLHRRPRHRLRWAFVLTVVAALVTAGITALVTAGSDSGAASGVPRPDHTVLVVMENHSLTQVQSAPYLKSLAAQGGLMTNSHAIAHPSEPNYLALWSGSTQGVTDDSCPHTHAGPSLGQQLLSAGLSVTGYNESMPSAGYLKCSGSSGGGSYARKHNPLADFAATSDATHNQTFAAFPTDYTKLPTVSMVVPNLCNDMHDCSVATGDNWLKAHLDRYAQWAKTHNSLLIVTFDENDNSAGNQIETILVGQRVRPGIYTTAVNHYGVLHTIEAAYGLSQLGTAAAPLTTIWNTTATGASGGTISNSSRGTATASSSTVKPTTTAKTSTASTTVSATKPTGITAVSSTKPVATPADTTGGGSTSTSSGGASVLRGAFYYPWFPNAWDQGGAYPFTHYSVTGGLYDSANAATVRQQIAAMQYGHLDFAIDSWWGIGSQEDSVVPADLAAASGTSFAWTLYYEPEGSGDPSVARISADLAYIKAKYASDPHFLHINGKPVIFVYGDGGDNCTTAARWAQANAGNGFYVDLKVFAGYTSCAQQPAAWHQYGPASATDSQKGQSFTISPGFFKAGETSPRLARNRTRWQANIDAMVASNAPMQLVTTFNEWGEGTAVESAQQWANGGYGTYLQDLHDLIP